VSKGVLPRGAIAPLATTFGSSGEIAYDAYHRQIEWIIGEKIHGIVIAGSTGEGYAIDADELKELADCAIDAAAGRVPVLASIIADDTRAACRSARSLRGKRVAAIQVVPPHYFFRIPDDGLVDFYARVAAAAELPVVIYNCVPWFHVGPGLAHRIFRECEGIEGVKQSIRDMSALVSMTAELGPERVYAAIDPALMSCYALGCVGSISALSTMAPRATSALYEAVVSADWERAKRLHDCLAVFCMAIDGADMPAMVKAALDLQDVPAGNPRSPLQPLSPARRHALAHAHEHLTATTRVILESSAKS